jgi:bacteriorhodopsin
MSGSAIADPVAHSPVWGPPAGGSDGPSHLYPKIVVAGEGSRFMGPHDIVGMTFLIAQNTMLAFTFFFMLERFSVPSRWQTSMTVAGMVTLVAFFNYQYMREAWIGIQTSPTTYRYTDWLVTVPLLILEFYTVLKATTRVGEQVFWRLLIASLVMLVGGYLGETLLIASSIGFAVGIAGWLYILYEVFAGESSQLSAQSSNAAGIRCFNTLRFLVAIGWAIYPIGYLLRGTSYEGVNIAYNLADLLNKGFFGLAVWAAAKSEDKY